MAASGQCHGVVELWRSGRCSYRPSDHTRLATPSHYTTPNGLLASKPAGTSTHRPHTTHPHERYPRERTHLGDRAHTSRVGYRNTQVCGAGGGVDSSPAWAGNQRGFTPPPVCSAVLGECLAPGGRTICYRLLSQTSGGPLGPTETQHSVGDAWPFSIPRMDGGGCMVTTRKHGRGRHGR